MRAFPKGFLVGAATAAHQVEGCNIHSDSWAQEHMPHSSYVEPSLDAVDHYHHYEEDIRLLAEAGLNAYRFSIEWARIEPEEGSIDESGIMHYHKVIECCKKYNVEPIVTLHHFTSPMWLIKKGGWEADTTPDDFARYVRVIMEKLGDELHYVCTINEANMGVQVAAIAARYLQQMKAQAAKAGGDSSVQMGINLQQMLENQKKMGEETRDVFGVDKAETFTSPRSPHGDEIVMEAHRKARDVIREIAPNVKVGLSLSLHDIQALPGGEAEAEKVWDEEFVHYLPAIADDDFLGVQNYTRACYDKNGSVPAPRDAELTEMGYEFYPTALEQVIRRVAKEFHAELIVTENGIATQDDTRRVAFIEQALSGVKACLEDGIPIKGYCYWSLLDNFEWQKGYSMHFGLIAVDRVHGQVRSPKPSLYALGEYAPKESE